MSEIRRGDVFMGDVGSAVPAGVGHMPGGDAYAGPSAAPASTARAESYEYLKTLSF
jgi:hypothetical protein